MKSKSTFPNIDSFNPKECIAGKAMKISRVVTQVFRKHMAAFDVTNSQLTVLFITAKRGAVTQKDLSDMLALEKSTISRNMKRLFDRGLLVKDKKEINITTEGKQFLEEIIPHWRNAMEEIRVLLKDDGEEALNAIIGKLIV